MARCVIVTVVFTLMVATGAAAQGPWIIENYTREGGGWNEVATGGYGQAPGNNVPYHWAEGFDGVRRVYWTFDFVDVSTEPKLYFVEQWIPSTTPDGVTWGWLPIEVTFNVGGGSNEAGTINWDIPWAGWGNTNHQWMGMEQDGTPGDFQQAGPGPQAPDSELCEAGPLGSHVWMQRGSTLYTAWGFVFPEGIPPHAVTALRITDAGAPEPEGCEWAEVPEVEGALDLGQIGNADPLYWYRPYLPFIRSERPFTNSYSKMVRQGDATLGAEGYTANPDGYGLTPGLPPAGVYAAHLTPGDPSDDVQFLLRYDANDTIKWRTDNDVSSLGRDRVFTLNDVPEQEFEERSYDKLCFLSTKSGAWGMLHIEAVYDDDSSDLFSARLYDWFGQDGDEDSIAVGVGGFRRTEVGTIGFRRLRSDGEPLGGGGDTGGAFLFVHPVDVDENKILKKVHLSVGEYAGQLNGSICILAASFVKGLPCNSPVFDADGDTDVDQDDFGVFQACFTGLDPAEGVLDWENCGCFDVDENEAVDETDYGAFEACASGPDAPADPACDDAVPSP